MIWGFQTLFSSPILTYIEIFKFLSFTNGNKNIKVRELGRMMFKILNDKFPDILNEYNLQIFEASKEK